VATSITLWILFGLAAGIVARLIHPKEEVGWVGTILLSVVGSLVGGGCAWFLQADLGVPHVAGICLAIVGAVAMIKLGVVSSEPQKTY
jgi:uncharacterized membrane protein YeaQ/YmgE (transglycosylase-associated protein family)